MKLGRMEGCEDSTNTGITLFGRPAKCKDLEIFCMHPDMVHANFSDLLHEVQVQCPVTCNTCGAVDPYMIQQIAPSTGTVGTGDHACKDHGPIHQALGNVEIGPKPINCDMVAKYLWCDHWSYYEQKVMKHICPASCNACTDDKKSGCFDAQDTEFWFQKAHAPARCDELRAYCAHPKWGPQVRKKCCRMCSSCSDSKPKELALKVLNKPATCPDLQRFCHTNNTHADRLIEMCPHSCKTCFNRRRRRTTRQRIIEW